MSISFTNPEYFGTKASNDRKKFSITKLAIFNVLLCKIWGERKNLGTAKVFWWRLIWIGYSSSINGCRNSVNDNVPIFSWDWKWKDPLFWLIYKDLKDKLLELKEPLIFDCLSFNSPSALIWNAKSLTGEVLKAGIKLSHSYEWRFNEKR